MELKVKEVGAVEEKSAVQVEEQLLEKAEQQHQEDVVEVNETPDIEKVDMSNTTEPEKEIETVEPEDTTEKESTQPSELNEEEVLSFIKNRYNKQINSVSDLLEERKESEELPEDVSAYFEYKKKTGRGIEDYVKLNRNFDDMPEDQLLTEYILATEEGLDKEDAELLMDDYSFDETLDDEVQVRKVKLARKKAIVKAKKFFNEQKEMYKQPLESSTGAFSEDSEEYKSYKQYVEQAKTFEQEQARKVSWFNQETDKVLNSEFKGFNFTIGDTKVLYNPGGSVDEIKKAQDTPMKFIGKYLDDQGLIKDAAGYHKALAAALNPDRFAKFFYEQGKSDATEDVNRKMKNINMTTRNAPEVTTKGKTQYRSISSSSGKGLKIKSIKRKS
jgi:hypothetical protein